MVKVKYINEKNNFEEYCLINENQVCEVKKGQIIKTDTYIAIVKMSNGDIYNIISPSYIEWENDIHLN